MWYTNNAAGLLLTLATFAGPGLAQNQPATSAGAVSLYFPPPLYARGVPASAPASVFSVDTLRTRTQFNFPTAVPSGAGEFLKNANITSDESNFDHRDLRFFIYDQHHTDIGPERTVNANNSEIVVTTTRILQMFGMCGVHTKSDTASCGNVTLWTYWVTGPPGSTTQLAASTTAFSGIYTGVKQGMMSVTITDGIAKLPTSTGGAMPVRTQAPGLAMAALLVGGAAAVL